jgi:hypothetical protein
LEHAILHGAHLEGAVLNDAHLEGANLTGTDLEKAKDLRSAHLEGARATDTTRWPDGFDWRAAGVILVDKEGNPVLVGPRAADEGESATPQPQERPATGGDLDAVGEARPND